MTCTPACEPLRPFGPEQVAVRAASSVIVVSDGPELEVLLLHRRQGSVFVGGMVVFPGGAVDDSDRAPEARLLVVGDPSVPDLDADAARSHLVAAVRETLEETGLWLGHEPAGPRAARREIDAGARHLVSVAEPHSIEAQRIPYAGRWVTPPGPPRRYDTRFFVALADRSIDLQPDGREVVALEWATPSAAMARIREGSLVALEPTIVYLEALREYRTGSEVVAAARAGEPIRHPGGWTTI